MRVHDTMLLIRATVTVITINHMDRACHSDIDLDIQILVIARTIVTEDAFNAGERVITDEVVIMGIMEPVIVQHNGVIEITDVGK
jgi:hypothetical protein